MAYLGNNEDQAEKDDSSDDDDRSSRKRKKSKDSSRSRRRSRSRERRRRSRSRDRRRSRSRSPKEKKPMKEGYGLIISEATKKRNSERRKDEKYESQFAKYKTNEPVGYTRREKHGFTKKLSAEEKAARLAKMAGNA